MTSAAKAVYAVLGTLSLVLGFLLLWTPALALPSDGYSPLTAHLVREQAALAIFLGLMAFWCLWHFHERRFVHFALLLFAALFSLVHWLEYLSGHRHLLSPIINSVPLVALGMTMPARRAKSEG